MSKTVRIPKNFVRHVKRAIIRLTIHPELYKRSEKFVRWSRGGPGQIPPWEIVLHALCTYPDLSLSAAVEAVLIDLLQNPPDDELARRFNDLGPIEKIRLAQRRQRMAHYLKNLPWSSAPHES